MHQRATREVIVRWLNQHLQTEGEAVWDIYIQLNARRYTLPYMWTTWMINSFEQGALHPQDPGEWIGFFQNNRSVILYNRPGELFLDDRSQVFQPPVTVAVKDLQEFKCLETLPRHRWWEAPFVCPYCNTLCLPQHPCGHLAVFDNWVLEAYQSTSLDQLLRPLFFRESNRNYSNYDHPCFRIKIQRDYYGNLEWFRSACWYVKSPSDVDALEKVLRDEV
jgi:hypothetical protein